jgi:hypothetical protein
MGADGLGERQLRAARNQSIFREVNERLSALNEAYERITPHDTDFVCECARADCMERIPMTATAYEELRQVATHFAVRPEHVLSDVERVVAEHRPHYVVVEKTGAAGDEAAALDPRSNPR